MRRVTAPRVMLSRCALPTKRRMGWAAVSAALLPWCFATPASADVSANTLPTGGTVVAGSATISRSGSNMEITQSSGSAILNWQNFSIGSNAWVNFIQPSASAIALNRVLGNRGSEIFGRLTANGQVFLSNPNGVLFAPGAAVDVGGLFATTLSIADKDFLAGRYNFYNAGGAGSVINQGNIVTASAYTALAGPQVRNDGVIVARAGTVALAAGDRVTLDMVGDGLIKVSVDQAALNASAINSGRIEADGGTVFLTARSANALLDTVINNSGVIRANSLIAHNGEVILDGGSSGVVANSGTVSVAGLDSGTTGGTVKILGDTISLLSGTRIDASGDAGGGTVLVGGNFHGSGPEQNASVTSMASDARINADALNSGDGGKVALWSSGDTVFAGSITARGGALSGNGGFIETSGRHLTVAHGAYVNASAAHGARGRWLLDPTDIDITDATVINTALGGGTDTVVTTDGNITVDDLIAWAAAATLTLSAGNDVVVNQTITGTGAGANVVLIADNDGNHSGTVVTNAAVSADNITIRYNPIGNDYSSPTVFNAAAATTLDTKMWVFVTADSKVYDATDVAALSLFGNAIANGASVASGTGNFDTRNAGTGKTVTYSGQSLASGGASFELFAAAGTTTADITPASLTINAVADSKVYDATTGSGGVPTISGLQGADTVSGQAQAYASKNVLGTNGSTLQVTTYTVNDGNSGNNYTVTTNSAAGTITPALLTVNAVTDTKVYDASTTSAALPTVSGLQGADSVSGRTQTYVSKNVLGTNGSTLQVTAYTVNDGNSGNNYTVSTNTAAGTITPASLTINAVSDTKVYDATTSSTAMPTVSGLQGVDTVSGQAQAYASKNVLGTNGSTLQVTAYIVNDGNSGNNYTVATNTAAGTITPASLTVNAVSDTKVYDATTTSAAGPTVSGLLGADSVSGRAQTYASKNVLGTNGSTLQVSAYTINDGNSGNNYTVTTNTALGTITPASLTINAATDTKVYDATTTSGGAPTISGLLGGDLVSGATQAYLSKNVLGTNGSTLQVTGYTVNDGNAGNNYAVTLNTAVGTITPASLSINAVTGTKVYDATTASGGAPTVSGLLGGDTVNGATQAYASKNVLGTNGSTLQVTAYTVNDGNSGNNYTVTTNTAAGTITPALLTINAATDTKVYDASTTSAALPTVSGLQGADSVSGRTQTYVSKNVLGTNGSTLQVTAYTVNDGNSGNNYTVSTNTAAGTITPASLIINAVTDTKVYDATTSSSAIPTVSGLQGADSVSGRTEAYASKNVLGTNGSTLQVTGYTVNDGNSGNNYTVTANTAAGTITPKALTAVSLTGTVSKTYDGNASATLTSANYTIGGFVAGEGATITNTAGSYVNGKDVQGPAAPVNSAVLAAGDYSAVPGTLLSNYNLSAVTGIAATGNVGQITRLASVSAIGNGLWSSASTWQGGAIPDKANVANVNLNGFAVTLDNSVFTNAGIVNVDSLTGAVAGSKLTFSSSNQLHILNALNLQGYAQTAGTVTTGTTFTITNNFNQTAGTINSTGAVNITQAGGGLSAVSIAGSGALTLSANSTTGDIVLASGGGLSGTTVSLTAGRAVSLSSTVSGSSAVNVSFGQQVAGTFTPTATISGATTVTGGSGADTFDFSSAPSITATLAGGAGSDTLKQSGGKTWTLNNATANAGSSGGLTWSGIENLTDTGAGTFNMGTAGSLSGTISAANGRVNYASYSAPVNFNLNGGSSSGMGSWNGITSVTGSAGNDTITGTGQTYIITGMNAGNNGTVAWTSFENLTDLGTGSLRATTATWTLNGSNTGTVTNLSGTFAGMGNLTDLGTGTFNMHGTADGSITGNLNGGTNGTLSYAGYNTGITVDLSGGVGSTSGVGGTRSGIAFVTGSSNSDTIIGAAATYNLTGQNSGSSGGLGWASFENITDLPGGTFFLFIQNGNVTGTLSSGSSMTLNSSSDITALKVSVPGTLTLIGTGTAPRWTLSGPPAIPHLETNNPATNVTYNNACIGGPACNIVIAIVGSINASVSQIAAQALKDAQATDSVAKQIDYGFAGDVGTTPPMDHRIDETGISTPDCFDESRDGQACKAN